jgi:transposase
MPEPLVSDALWEKVEPLLPKPRRKNRHVQHAGRKRSDPRRVLNGIVFVLRTGVPWKHLPSTHDFPCGETCRQWLLRWHRSGVWKKLSRQLLAELHSQGLLRWGRAVIDSASVRAPGGGRKTGKSPVDRRKLGVKHHVLTDAQGTPLAVLISGAQRHDVTQLLPLVQKVPPVAGRRGRPRRRPKSLYGDRAYDSEPHRQALKKNRHSPLPRQKAHRARQRTRPDTVGR